MTLLQILDASGLALLSGQGVWIALLYRRMGRLRTSLESAGEVVTQLDAASRRLDTSAGGIVQRVKDGIAEVDSKIAACRRIAQELTGASRHAEEIATRLDQALRQSRKLHTARAAAPPREAVEPRGFAERLAARTGAPLPALEEGTAAGLMAAELVFAPPPAMPEMAELLPQAAQRTVRVRLD